MSPELQQLKEDLQIEYEQAKSRLNSTKDINVAAIMSGVIVTYENVFDKIEDIATRSTKEPFKSNGDWVQQISRGFLGYRCRKCYCWKYPNEEKRCSCDPSVS
jgi:hypothetical protein